MLVEASLVLGMGQHLGPVEREEEATAVRCRHTVVAAVGSVAAAVVAAVGVGECIVLFLSVEGMRAGDRLMYQTIVFSSLLEPVNMIYAVQVRHRCTPGLTSSASNNSYTNFFGSTNQYQSLKPENGVSTEKGMQRGSKPELMKSAS
jgi:hypothetical protein